MNLWVLPSITMLYPSAKTGFSFNADDVQSIRSNLKGDFVVGHIGALGRQP